MSGKTVSLADLADGKALLVIFLCNHCPYVKHVADVKEGETFPRGNAGFNGKEAVSVVVQKQYGGDTVATIDNPPINKATANSPEIRVNGLY